jgi:hypothetical protein
LLIENRRPAAAFGGLFMANLPLREVVGLRDLVRQAAVYQGVILAAKLLAPHAIFDEPLKDLVQAERRNVFTPDWHGSYIGRSTGKTLGGRGKNQQRRGRLKINTAAGA